MKTTVTVPASIASYTAQAMSSGMLSVQSRRPAGANSTDRPSFAPRQNGTEASLPSPSLISDKRDEYLQSRPFSGNAVYNVDDIRNNPHAGSRTPSATLDPAYNRQEKELIADILLAMGIKSLRIFREEESAKREFTRTV